MKNKILKTEHNNKLNSKVGRILTLKQLIEFTSKTPNKIKGLIT